MYAESYSSSSRSVSDGSGGFITHQSTNENGIESRQILVGDVSGNVAVIDNNLESNDEESYDNGDDDSDYLEGDDSVNDDDEDYLDYEE